MSRTVKYFALVVCIAAIAVGASAATTDRAIPAPDVKSANDGHPGPATRDTGGPDPFGYAWIDSLEPGGPTYSWVDISTTGTSILLSDDATAGPFPIGFSFGFYGGSFSNFYVSSNGWVTFVAPSGSDLSNDCPMPTNGTPNNMLALMWDDLDPGDNGDPIYYESFAAGACPYGTYGGACTVIQYEDFCHFPGGATCAVAGTFEAILFDNGEILYQYEDAGDETGSGATTGIQNGDSSIGLTYGCDGNYLADGRAVLFFLPPQGDLEITKTAPDGFGENGPFTFEIAVTNNGPENQTGVAVVDTIPAELTYLSDDCGGSFAAPNWTWTIGNLANGASDTCTMVVEFTGGSCVAATNTATVSGTVFDPPGNNTSSTSNAFESVADGSFEDGTPNSFWVEFSSNFGTPLCDLAGCGTGTGTGPRTGDWWCWFGGISGVTETGSVTQVVNISEGATDMTFWVEAIVCDSPNDFMNVTIDGNIVYSIDGGSPLCGVLGYSQQTVDISAYADGGDHTLEFVSTTVSTNGGGTNFFIDDVSIAGVTCTQAPPIGDNAIPTVNGIGIVFLVGLIIGAAIVILRRMT
jgi:uncharacterized repeat protein (TIGR01451 family)